MTRDETEALIRQLHEIRKSNDADKVVEFFRDDVVYSVAGCSEHSLLPCNLKGRDAFMPMLRMLAETFTWDEIEFHDILIDGDRAAVFYTLTTTHAPSGKQFSTPVSDHLTFRDGKVATFTQHIDTARVNASMG